MPRRAVLVAAATATAGEDRERLTGLQSHRGTVADLEVRQSVETLPRLDDQRSVVLVA